ncbi:MAG: efflux RND transporter permease subunit, partial [bacterium]|nr:efflux RND transporter permease subunit [bacterium]
GRSIQVGSAQNPPVCSDCGRQHCFDCRRIFLLQEVRTSSVLFSLVGGIWLMYLIMWATRTGSEAMKRIAAPMVGGMVSSTVLTLVVIPAIYALWKG